MFGNANKEANKPKSTAAPATSSNAFNTLVQGTVVEGTVKADSDIRVDGVIKGKLFCDAKVIIGPSGSVEGEIKCQNAVIEGRFDGVLTVAELLNVRETATVNGDVTTGKLIVQSGAIFSVTCAMTGAKSGSAVINKEIQTGVKTGKPAEA